MSDFKICYDSPRFQVFTGKPGILVYSKKTKKEVILTSNSRYFEKYLEVFVRPVSSAECESTAIKILG